MDFMAFAKGYQIFVFGVFEELQPLVDNDVVHDKIAQTVSKNTQADKETIIKTSLLLRSKTTGYWEWQKSRKINHFVRKYERI